MWGKGGGLLFFITVSGLNNYCTMHTLPELICRLNKDATAEKTLNTAEVQNKS